MAPESSKMLCIICGQSSKLMCQRCEEPYCSDVCQRRDWQRHKYICRTMPPLVSLETLRITTIARNESVEGAVAAYHFPSQNAGLQSKTKNLPAQPTNSSSNRNVEVSLVDPLSSEQVKLSNLWREHDLPPPQEYFDFRVSYIEQDGTIWVVDAANIERLERLTEKMARVLQNKNPCSLKELSVSDLVCAAIDGKIFRAEVMALNAYASCTEVRLIDFGLVVNCSVRNIYLPLNRMAECKAFAFKVRLLSNTGVQINKNISMRMLGTTTPDGIEQAQLKSSAKIPLNLPVEILAISPEVKVVQILEHNITLKEPQVALLQIAARSNINDDLNTSLTEMPGQPFTGPFPDEMHSFFLAAKTKQGYRRAFVLDFIEKSSLFLVYEMDEGRISMTNDVRRIPSDLISQPMRVFAISLPVDHPSALQEHLEKSARDLCIKFQAETFQSKQHDKLHSAQASLLSQNKEICSVGVSKFLGRVSELGHKYWREPIENGSLVYITHYIDYQEVCISSVETRQYAEIFKSLQTKCQPFTESSNVAIGSLVLVESADHGYYRAEITSIEKSKFSVYNIDSGSRHRVTLECLRKPCRFVECLPVSHCRAKIKTICNIPASAVPPNTVALQLLVTLHNKKTELQVEFNECDRNTLDLLDFSTEPQSLITRMLPLIFTPAAVQLAPANNLPCASATEAGFIQTPEVEPETNSPNLQPSLPVSSIPVEKSSTKQTKRYYFNDVERLLMPLNDKLEIMVLNAVGLHKTGYVTACSFCNEKEVEDFQDMLDRVAENGCNNKNLLPGYLPDVGEMCLVFFAEDNSWYRGVCQKVSSQKAHILYTDFGNEETVPLERIKPIPSTLLSGVRATRSFIDGFDKTKDFKVLEEYLAAKGKILCSVLEGPEPNTRLLNIPILSKILSKELI